jgi:purine-binding chemotaxis protein CheW
MSATPAAPHELDHRLSFNVDGNQYLTFSIGGEVYGVEILRVQEIKGFCTVTPVPNAPSFVSGVMNLRGTIVPVIDLRQRLGLSRADANRFTVIVVVNVNDRVSGLVVDSVSDVLTIPAESIQPPPELGMRQEARFVRGMAKVGERLAILLDAERLLRFDDGVKSADAS